MDKKRYICEMGVTCLVWNIEKASDDRLHRIIEAIRSWIASEDIHIVALLECSLANAKIINDQLGTDWQLISTDASGMIRVFSRLKSEGGVCLESYDITKGSYKSMILQAIRLAEPSISDQEMLNRYLQISHKLRWFYLSYEGKQPILLLFCHLYSKVSQAENWRSSLLISAIQNLIYGTFKTDQHSILITGDLNNNPFETELYLNG